MYKLGWKVINYKSNPGSAFITPTMKGFVRYPFSKKTTPQPGCGPLCVFGKKTDAERFARQFHGRKAYPCAYRPSIYNQVWRSVNSSVIRLLEFLPKGTVLADEVVLLKEAPRGPGN